MCPVMLEDFGDKAASRPLRHSGEATPEAGAHPGPVSAPDIERARLAGYEEGYRAGWDDAARQEAEEQGRIGAEFARNLRDLGFTYHEARVHVMQALEPLLAGMVARVLPALVSETIGQTIVEELLPLAAEAADTPIDVVVAPSGRKALETFLHEATAVPFRLIEEPTLAEGQVYLRAPTAERHIDMTQAVERIRTTIRGLYELNEKAFQNG